jgi:hypothetical protein
MFRRIAALVLLSLWLPATLHCDLEAAGLEIAFVCHDHEVPVAPVSPCAADACHAIEDAAYTAIVLNKFVGEAALTVIALLPEPVEVPAAAISPERTDVPRELGRAWQFRTRAAPPVRAPSAAV